MFLISQFKYDLMSLQMQTTMADRMRFLAWGVSVNGYFDFVCIIEVLQGIFIQLHTSLLSSAGSPLWAQSDVDSQLLMHVSSSVS